MAFSSSDWSRYVGNITEQVDIIDDVEDLQHSLQTRSQLLFLDVHSPLEIWKCTAADGTDNVQHVLTKTTGTTSDEINTLFSSDVKRSLTILRQRSSWSHLMLSSEQFCTVMVQHEVLAAFWRIVNAFGSKDCESDIGFDGYRYQEWANRSSESRQTANGEMNFRKEICYRLPYPHKHGRTLSDQWSIRHSGVYSCSRMGRLSAFRNGNWILIQPALRLERIMESFMSYRFDQEEEEINLHLRFVSFAIGQWREYFNDLTCMFDSFMQKGNFVSFSITDLSCTINDYQALRQVYHDKVLEVQAELLATGRIIDGLKDAISRSYSTGHDSITHLSNQLAFLQTGFAQLLQRITAASQLLSNVIKIMERDATVSNSLLISNIATATKINADESRMLHGQAIMTRNDSNFMRAAALVGLVYVPSNYVATMFQASIVNVDNFGLKIMLFVVLSAALTGLTLGFSTWWQRRIIVQANKSSAIPTP